MSNRNITKKCKFIIYEVMQRNREMGHVEKDEGDLCPTLDTRSLIDDYDDEAMIKSSLL